MHILEFHNCELHTCTCRHTTASFSRTNYCSFRVLRKVQGSCFKYNARNRRSSDRHKAIDFQASGGSRREGRGGSDRRSTRAPPDSGRFGRGNPSRRLWRLGSAPLVPRTSTPHFSRGALNPLPHPTLAPHSRAFWIRPCFKRRIFTRHIVTPTQSLTRCSAIAERPRCRVRYSFRQK